MPFFLWSFDYRGHDASCPSFIIHSVTWLTGLKLNSTNLLENAYLQAFISCRGRIYPPRLFLVILRAGLMNQAPTLEKLKTFFFNFEF